MTGSAWAARNCSSGPGGSRPGRAPRSPARDLKTIREISVTDMVMVVGDIIGFSTIAETTGDRVLLENIDRLYAGLRQILARHHGTLSNYVGDAFFATWEAAALDGAAPDGAAAGGGALDPARSAVAFTVEAAETVPRIAAGLDLRDPGGGPLRMGWGVALGPAAVSQLTGMLVTVLGDATNVAFRLSGLAGRDGRPGVLVTDAVYRATSAGLRLHLAVRDPGQGPQPAGPGARRQPAVRPGPRPSAAPVAAPQLGDLRRGDLRAVLDRRGDPRRRPRAWLPSTMPPTARSAREHQPPVGRSRRIRARAPRDQ